MSAKQLCAIPARIAATARCFIDMIWRSNQILRTESNTSFPILVPGPFFCHDHRDRDGDRKNEHDHSERNRGRQPKIIRHDHLDANESEYKRKASFQIDEAIHELCQQEIERTQAEDGADV